MLAAAIRTREERILSIQSERPNGAFDNVGVDLDVAVIEEAAQSNPA